MVVFVAYITGLFAPLLTCGFLAICAQALIPFLNDTSALGLVVYGSLLLLTYAFAIMGSISGTLVTLGNAGHIVATWSAAGCFLCVLLLRFKYHTSKFLLYALSVLFVLWLLSFGILIQQPTNQLIDGTRTFSPQTITLQTLNQTDWRGSDYVASSLCYPSYCQGFVWQQSLLLPVKSIPTLLGGFSVIADNNYFAKVVYNGTLANPFYYYGGCLPHTIEIQCSPAYRVVLGKIWIGHDCPFESVYAPIPYNESRCVSVDSSALTYVMFLGLAMLVFMAAFVAIVEKKENVLEHGDEQGNEMLVLHHEGDANIAIHGVVGAEDVSDLDTMSDQEEEVVNGV
jgi:hypothetical protein